MSTRRGARATGGSPLRLAVLLLALLAAVVLGSVHTGEAVAHPAPTVSASQPDSDAPCLPHPDYPEHSARALGGAFTGADLADGDAHTAEGPDRFAVRAVPMPAERLTAAETGRLLAVLCVWRT
ncbi:hypothetical protein [Phytomonospora endophytica]|uniref:Uncharacterized protein n=1 Tax=Phytomonospora endophytica TaxID=714109 RepID=A0A841FMB9_9ACTN|nr:hypothetical protein [Phytomonospora endophytica]MBB6034347.1 hypothetical protein [Phytomonospora endophytica]